MLPAEMEIKVEGAEVTVARPNDLKKMKSLHGLTRTLVNNMVVGVDIRLREEARSKRCRLQGSKSGKRN